MKWTDNHSRVLASCCFRRCALYRTFGTTGLGVALPAVVGARMCVEGEAEKGTIVAECLDPVRFLKIMAGMGASINLQETCSKRIATP